MRIIPLLFPVILAVTLQSVLAASPGSGAGASPSDTVDRKRVHAEYGDGNFESVVQILEEFRSGHEAYGSGDSLFIAKYLGVVYTSNPDTREKGKYWLYKMLQLQPSADLVDLYVGGEVDRTFEKVRQEFIVRRNYRGINDTRLARSVQDGDPGKKDTVVLKDTVVIKNDNWIAPLTDGIKGGYSEVKGGIKAGIQGGYESIKEEPRKDGSRWTGNVNFGAGIKFLNAAQWERVGFTDQTEFRFSLDVRQLKWPINIALGATYAYAPEVLADLRGDGTTPDFGIPTQSVATYEVNLGIRKIFDFRLYSVRPFFGGGFGRITTQWSFEGDKYDETFREGKIGVWCDGGLYWELDRHFNIGLEYMYSWANIELLGKRNHGGHHMGMIAGYHY